jgi:hypothetical protein
VNIQSFATGKIVRLATIASCLLLVLSASISGQNSSPDRPSQARAASNDDISGMYTFLREGEFVQITVEEGRLSGFVSRYGDGDSDKDAFLDQFFTKASLEGKKISFTTKPVHGTWFEFNGTVARGDGQSRDKEGFWVIKGVLKKFSQDENKNVDVKSREVTLKSFPQDAE